MGTKSATVVLQTDSSDLPTVTLHLTGVGFVLGFQVDPTDMEFGGVVIVGSGSIRTVTLTNTAGIALGLTPTISGPAASLFGTDRTLGMQISLPAYGSVPVQVTYSPLAPSSLDTAMLNLALNVGGTLSILLDGHGLQTGLQLVPSFLDFRFVQPGDAMTLPCHLTNVGNETVQVSSVTIVDPANPPAFSIAGDSWLGGIIAPGASQDVDVIFAPSRLGENCGELDNSSTEECNDQQRHSGIADWFSGVVRSSSAPRQSSTSARPRPGSWITLPMSCTNQGSDVPGHPEAGLILSTLQADNPLFTAQVDPLSTNPASLDRPLAAGQSVQLEVTYEPISTGNDHGTLRIGSNATDRTTSAPTTVSLMGEGVLEGPCVYSITPLALDFGQVRIGAVLTAGFSIQNLGLQRVSLVEGLNVTPDTDDAFSLPNDAVASQRLPAPTVPPGPYPTEIEVPVAFAPLQSRGYAGAVQLTLSDPAAPVHLVNLSAQGGSSCFLGSTGRPQFWNSREGQTVSSAPALASSSSP